MTIFESEMLYPLFVLILIAVFKLKTSLTVDELIAHFVLEVKLVWYKIERSLTDELHMGLKASRRVYLKVTVTTCSRDRLGSSV